MIKDIESVTANLDIRRCRETKRLLQISVIVPVSRCSIAVATAIPECVWSGISKIGRIEPLS